MILTVCPCPCIDVSMEVDSLGVGRANKIISKRTFYTGKALNVAVGLARLNARVFATGFMFEENGNNFEHELHREGVPYKFVWNKGRASENYSIIDNKSMLTEFDDAGPEVCAEKKDELISLVARMAGNCECVVISGGLPNGVNPDFYGEIIKAVPKSVATVVDAEGDSLKEALKHGVHLVKPNLGELERTFGKKIATKQEMLAACGEVLDMGAKYVLLSLGKQGAVITDGSSNFYCKSVNVAMNSTVGAGDAMVAAAAGALVKNAPLREILCCGVAAGTAAVTQPESISFTKEKYEEILSNLSVKKF